MEEPKPKRDYKRKSDKNRKWPYLARYRGDVYHAFYIENDRKLIRSLGETDQIRAYEKFRKLLADLDRGIIGFSRKPQYVSFKSVADQVLEYLGNWRATDFDQKKPHSLSWQTVRRYKQVISNQLIPYFGKQSIRAITRRMARTFFEKRKTERTENTARNEIAGLRYIYNWAIDREIVNIANPAKEVWKRGEIKVRKPYYTPNIEEIQRIRIHIDPRARRFLDALIGSGCRLGEIQKANVGDIDWTEWHLRVVRKGGEVSAHA